MSSLNTLIDTDADRGNPLLGKAWYDDEEYKFDPGEIAAVERMSYKDRRAARDELEPSKAAPYVSDMLKMEALKRLVAVIEYVERQERERAAAEDDECLELSGFDSSTGQAYDDSGFWGEEDYGDEEEDCDEDDINDRMIIDLAQQEEVDEERRKEIEEEERREDALYAIQDGLSEEGRHLRRRAGKSSERLHLLVLRTANGLEKYQEVKLDNVPGAVRAFYKGHKPAFGTDTVHMSAHVSLGQGRQIFVGRSFDQCPDDQRFSDQLEALVDELGRKIADYKN